MIAKIKLYSLEALTAVVFLTLLYTAARAEVLDVMNSAGSSHVVAASAAH